MFANGMAVCTACNTQYKIDHVFENAEVCICYIENDNNGRRTKDSILSQELYQKLEAKNIRTFYERVSASDLADDDLEQMRYSAIYSANVILAVGTSVENFEAILEKYGQYFTDKTVIPFCADIKPADIPPSLSKIQAIDYAAIGWESDLIKGVLRILGREAEIEQQEKKASSRKIKAIIISIIAAICLIAIGILVFVNFNKDPQTKEESSELTDQQIYENAQELYNNDKFADALIEFVKIRDYKDSAQQIKTILNLYDGYYQTDDEKFSVYFNVLSDSEILLELTTVSDYGTADATVEGTWAGAKNTYSLTDTFANSGTVTLTLQNDGISILIEMEKTGEFASIGNQNATFKFTDKTDREQITRITGGLLMSWLKTPTTKETLVELGVIEGLGGSITDGGGVIFYDAVHTLITDQNVTVLLADKDPNQDLIYDTNNAEKDFPQIVYAISAPAQYLIPDKVGTVQKAFVENDVLFVPNGDVREFDYAGLGNFIYIYENNPNSNSSDEIIQPDTPVAVIYREIVGNELFVRSVRQCVEIEDKIEIDTKLYGSGATYLKEDDDAYIFSSHEQDCCMYKIDKKTFAIVEVSSIFIGFTDGELNVYANPSYDSEVTSSLPKGRQFHVQETQTGSDGKLWGKLIFGDGWICLTDTCEMKEISDWQKKVAAKIEDIAIKLTQEKYPGELPSWNPYHIAAENDTHILIYVRTQPLAEMHKCAWYKGNKQTGEVTFLRTGIYLETPLQPGEWTSTPLKIVDYLWFREYRDLAKEFPSLHGDPDSSENFFASSPELPYLLNSDKRPLTFNIYAEPSYGNLIDSCLESGEIHTIIEEQYDDEYNLWGKLSDGSGWVCVSDIVSEYYDILSSH